MSPYEFFKQLSYGKYKATFSEFYTHWNEALDNPNSPDIYAHIFFYAAKSCSLGNKVFFLSDRDYIQSYNLLLNKSASWAAVAKENSLKFDAHEIQLVSSALNMLHFTSSIDFNYILIDQSITQMAFADSKNLVGQIRNIAEAGRYPGDHWINAWWKCAQDSLDKFTFKEAINIIHVLAILDSLRKEIVPDNQSSPCHDIATRLFPELSLGSTLQSQIYHSALWFDIDFNDRFSYEEETNTSSLSEKKYKNSLAEHGVTFYGCYIKHMRHHVDLWATFNKQSYGIEIDGPSHFNFGIFSKESPIKQVYDGNTKFQSALIKKCLPKDMPVIRIPDVPLNLFNRLSINQIVAEILDSAQEIQTGVYVFHGQNDIRPIYNPRAWEFIATFRPL